MDEVNDSGHLFTRTGVFVCFALNDVAQQLSLHLVCDIPARRARTNGWVILPHVRITPVALKARPA